MTGVMGMEKTEKQGEREEIGKNVAEEVPQSHKNLAGNEQSAEELKNTETVQVGGGVPTE